MLKIAKRNMKGFTLVELSIVLVIIGLIVGGVLVGKDLIEIAELRKFGKQVDDINIALNLFDNKFNGRVPGDMNNATIMWPGETTNGNGNGRAIGAIETFLAWQHLSLAGVVTGDYTGSGIANYRVQAGINSPASIIDNNGLFLYHDENGWDDLLIMYKLLSVPNAPFTASFNPERAYAYDFKFDDGLPRQGEIQVGDGYYEFRLLDLPASSVQITQVGSQGECTGQPIGAVPFNDPSDEYNLSSSAQTCLLMIKLN